MDSKSTFIFASQIGLLMVGLNQQKVTSLVINEKLVKNGQLSMAVSDADNKIRDILSQQLKNYFSSACLFKNIPLAAKGTEFQKRVWRELVKIPPGETRTYAEVAKILNSGARAVGNACRNNPVQIIIPCHRVISVKGLGGYAGEVEGEQINIKRWLLEHEGVVV